MNSTYTVFPKKCMKQDQHICWKKENIIFLIDYIFYKLFLQFLLMKNSLRGKDLSPYYVEPDQPCRGRKAGEYKKHKLTTESFLKYLQLSLRFWSEFSCPGGFGLQPLSFFSPALHLECEEQRVEHRSPLLWTSSSFEVLSFSASDLHSMFSFGWLAARLFFFAFL